MIEAWWVNRQLKRMYSNGFSQGFERQRPWVEKSNGLRLEWIEVEAIVQEPVVNPLSARFYRSDLMCERRHVCTYIQLNDIIVLMKGCKIAGIWQIRIYDTGDRWYEENKENWTKDGALGYIYICAYSCVGWGWRVNFKKGSAVSQIGANLRDDTARKTNGMLKSVEKCGMVESVSCQLLSTVSSFCFWELRLPDHLPMQI